MKVAPSLLAVASICCLLLTSTRAQNEQTVNSAENNETDLTNSEEVGQKRGWNDLGSAWGKRDWNKLQGVWGKRAWSSLQHGWGKRESQELENYNQLENYKKAWNQLHSAWGKRVIAADDSEDQVDSQIAESKRGWNSLQGSWGKRIKELDEDLLQVLEKRTWDSIKTALKKRQHEAIGKGTDWSRKRETGWNNLKGLWG